MVIFLIGFVVTCRNNKKKMMAQREIEKYAALSDDEDQENEMRNFSEFFGDNKDSDEDAESQLNPQEKVGKRRNGKI